MISKGQLRKNMPIRDARGERLGRVVDIDGSTVHAVRGFFWRRPFSFALSEAQGVRQGALILPRPPHGLGLTPGALEQARMDSTKFQNHRPYDLSKRARHHVTPFEDARMDSAKFQSHHPPREE